MQPPPRPSLDLELLILIAVGIVSTLALGWFFLSNNQTQLPPTPTIEPTVTLSDIGSLPTRTRLPPSVTPTATQEEPLATATDATPVAYPGPPAEAVTPDQLLPVGKHDNTDPRINYDRYWTSEMNSGTSFAYQGTLHISPGIGNEASFQFSGQRFYLGYQRGRNFGIMTVMIDGQAYRFHQQAVDRIWRSPALAPGIHSVRLIHETGETVNLDYIEILE